MYLNLNRYAEADEDASAVLDVDPSDCKALFRRAIARIHKLPPENDGALSDITQVAWQEPQNVQVSRISSPAKSLICAYRTS